MENHHTPKHSIEDTESVNKISFADLKANLLREDDSVEITEHVPSIATLYETMSPTSAAIFDQMRAEGLLEPGLPETELDSSPSVDTIETMSDIPTRIEVSKKQFAVREVIPQSESLKNKEKTGRFNRIKKGLVKSALFGVVASAVAASFFGAGPANSAPSKQVTVATSGRGDPTGQGMKANMSSYFGGGNVVMNKYPAQIAPLDGIRMDASVNDGVANGEAAIIRSGVTDKNLHLVGYSEGSVVATKLLENHPEASITVIGGPGTPDEGLAYSPIAQAVSPILSGMGINLQDSKLPKYHGKATFVRKEQDVYASGNNGVNIVGNIAQGLDTVVGDGHIYSNKDLRNPNNRVEHKADGSTVIVVPDNGVNGFGEVAKKNGLQWNKQVNELTNMAGGFAADGRSVKPATPSELFNAGVAVVEQAAKDNNVRIPAIAKLPSSPTQRNAAPQADPMQGLNNLAVKANTDFQQAQKQFNSFLGNLKIPR